MSDKEKELKACTCKEQKFDIGILPLPPERYKGRSTCLNCGNYIQFPIKRSVSKVKAELEKFITHMGSKNMSAERAIVLLLVEIRDLLKPKSAPEKKSKKDKK